MPAYVCAESALEHYRCATIPALEGAATQDVPALSDAVSSLKEVRLQHLAGLGLPEPTPRTPLHVLVPPGAPRGGSESVLPTVWGGVLPQGALRKVTHDAHVSSPEFLFLQMARKLEPVPLIELGMELCGTYRRNSSSGDTSYDQPVLTTPAKIERFLEDVGPAHGAKRARQALKHIAPNSASPFETIVYLLLCLPRRLGGYAFPKPALNASVRLGKRGRKHTLRRSSYPDLYWEFAKLDLECHGSVHELEETRTEDSMRRKALERMGVEVVELTYDEVKNERLFRATVRRLATKLSVRLRARTENGFESHEKTLRDTLLASASSEPRLPAWPAPLDDPFDRDLESWLGEELPPEYDSWEAFCEAGDEAGWPDEVEVEVGCFGADADEEVG